MRTLLPFALLPAVVQAQPVNGLPGATPEEQLSEGENFFLYGDFHQAIERLRPLVQPVPRLPDPTDLARAYEVLGLAYFFLDKLEEARWAFEELIRRQPDRQLDPVVVPPPGITFFNRIRRELEPELARQREALRQQREAEERARIEANKIIVEKRRNSLFVAAMPFGIGQFQNDDLALGATFLATELLAIGLSAGFFFAVEDLRQANGRFRARDVEQAQSLQQAQLISGGVALGLMAVGIVHALITFEEDIELREHTAGGGNGSGFLRWTF